MPGERRDASGANRSGLGDGAAPCARRPPPRQVAPCVISRCTVPSRESTHAIALLHLDACDESGAMVPKHANAMACAVALPPDARERPTCGRSGVHAGLHLQPPKPRVRDVGDAADSTNSPTSSFRPGAGPASPRAALSTARPNPSLDHQTQSIDRPSGAAGARVRSTRIGDPHTEASGGGFAAPLIAAGGLRMRHLRPHPLNDVSNMPVRNPRITAKAAWSSQRCR